MKKLISKSCKKCGNPIQGIPRKDRKAFYYPPACSSCHGFKHRIGVNSPVWKGGIKKVRGYIMIWIKKHKYIMEHRLVWEKANGAIPKGFHIHHLNHIRDDNRLENLQLISHKNHSILHGHASKTKGRWAINYDFCIECKKPILPHWAKGFCRRCYLRNWARKQ